MHAPQRLWEDGMATSSAFFYLLRVLSWLNSALRAIPRHFASKRDKRLKKSKCTLTWIDEGMGHQVFVDVKAESEEQARQFANTAAIKNVSKVPKKPLSKDELDPPYVKDAVATLPQWKVEAIPLTDTDREQVEQGEFGPAGAYNVGSAVG
jgi:hypothetical protein